MWKLSQLAGFDAVVLQCHDNPDADTVASAFALSSYFSERDVHVRMVYSGFHQMTKPNLLLMVQALQIPIEYIDKSNLDMKHLLPDAKAPLLITVDCQHGAGNVSRIAADRVIVIDHHIKERDEFEAAVIEPYLGSCSTVVWRLLKAEQYDFVAHRDVSTALYYGLYADTNSLSEIFHPIDRDMLESLQFDARLVKQLKGNNLTKDELLLAGKALNEAHYDDARRSVLFEAEHCDPNILGFISDLTVQVESVDTCVGFCRINGGVKLSLRSATYDVMANELAAYLTQGMGSGGGNKEKAGGFMKLSPGASPREFLLDRIEHYHVAYDKYVAGEYQPDVARMTKYKKRKLMIGYVLLTDIYEEGTDVTVRTLEGDAAFRVSGETRLMVGVQGETYPISEKKFSSSYKTLCVPFRFDPAFIKDRFYAPTVRDKLYEKTVQLEPYIRACEPLGEAFIYAQPLERDSKVFTKWYTEGYMYGRAGDYLAARSDDLSDIYVINADIFDLTYERIE